MCYLVMKPRLIEATALLAANDRSSSGSKQKASHALLSEYRGFKVSFQMAIREEDSISCNAF